MSEGEPKSKIEQISNAINFGELKLFAEDLVEGEDFNSAEWNVEGIIDTIGDVEKHVDGTFDRNGETRHVDKKDTIKMTIERFPKDGVLGAIRNKLVELSGIEN
ncbi:MAG: hypothetical protein A2312_03015 [Candidatus Staskawiczbacteria bacterium RIFOXYB2_FULL_32_9]|uniref:Uncharacterized protein n=1 Tax=Candidatus Staskawiczbacteria bacterium RIFOXYD1_FULL_32_13 TaxID=1802234 RepID=A0A1G2JP11_9BACT|nr:MAG: hypothetical protein UR22_C0002G0061 [Parcubacteria group bacterium GW2011_GWC2_32_10]OGZ78112.1 MAG: hypothetical protein A2256_03845 [Candidatus Staskawiczbacteria bacterium RIFOXYA2_FULL_32_7]OGZ78662.1 MAG: hypothetical protein A2360_00510 [Candidatus Staskawiczbacteria bacterium RIFOXYB1_FULL_32_11]OGZ81545.1 MAG: hypothetical protein A2312_03015 [Candidatus Staskawiczbacteria bacterium RIFOXYB2_FULL_32_9]OGZ86901.1 MAG: hypothetical protein A2463_01995 [Candidatus Staskawiczbacter